jgi:hypothetical protein
MDISTKDEIHKKVVISLQIKKFFQYSRLLFVSAKLSYQIASINYYHI